MAKHILIGAEAPTHVIEAVNLGVYRARLWRPACMSNQTTYVFLMFVADREVEVRTWFSAWTTALDRCLPGQYRLEVVDVLREPERAEDDKVFATPMLVRSRPAPPVRILGDLSRPEQVLALLGLDMPPAS
ncbi:MAG: circadian clock KaiB family protein [Hydrogenophaga sp.]